MKFISKNKLSFLFAVLNTCLVMLFANYNYLDEKLRLEKFYDKIDVYEIFWKLIMIVSFATFLLFYFSYVQENLICKYKIKIQKIYVDALRLLISIIMSVLFVIMLYEDVNPYVSFDEDMLLLYLSFEAIVILCAIYLIVKNNGITLKEYVIKLFINCIYVLLCLVIVAVGVFIIYYIFSELFGYNSNILFTIECGVFSFISLAGTIFALQNIKIEVNKFFKIMIYVVMLVMTCIAYIIVFAYFLKIVITKNIPSNQIYLIVSLMFVIGCPVGLMSETSENSLIRKIANAIPIAFICGYVMQVYSIFARVMQYGMSSPRFYGILFIIFEFAYIFLHTLKREKLNFIIVVAVLLLSVGCCV